MQLGAVWRRSSAVVRTRPHNCCSLDERGLLLDRDIGRSLLEKGRGKKEVKRGNIRPIHPATAKLREVYAKLGI